MRSPELTVSVRLRAEDAEELWHYCESQLDSSTGPTRWVWWRIAQLPRGDSAADRSVSWHGGPSRGLSRTLTVFGGLP